MNTTRIELPHSKISLIQIEDFTLNIKRSNIKNMYLRIHPLHGVISISAPNNTTDHNIAQFVRAKTNWINNKLQAIKSLLPIVSQQYLTGDLHLFRGNNYQLKIIINQQSPQVMLEANKICLMLRPEINTIEHKYQMLNNWYRQYLINALPDLINKYELIMGVKVSNFGIRSMKTRWGSCNPGTHKIWLNLDLAKKPPILLEYVVVHEMVHLLEASHNARFYKLMTKFMPDWQIHKRSLATMPIS